MNATLVATLVNWVVLVPAAMAYRSVHREPMDDETRGTVYLVGAGFLLLTILLIIPSRRALSVVHLYASDVHGGLIVSPRLIVSQGLVVAEACALSFLLWAGFIRRGAAAVTLHDTVWALGRVVVVAWVAAYGVVPLFWSASEQDPVVAAMIARDVGNALGPLWLLLAASRLFLKLRGVEPGVSGTRSG